jgi:RNA-directed DNA polymerase
MSAATQACAPSGATWDGINWAKVDGDNQQVRRSDNHLVR